MTANLVMTDFGHWLQQVECIGMERVSRKLAVLISKACPSFDSRDEFHYYSGLNDAKLLNMSFSTHVSDARKEILDKVLNSGSQEEFLYWLDMLSIEGLTESICEDVIQKMAQLLSLNDLSEEFSKRYHHLKGMLDGMYLNIEL